MLENSGCASRGLDSPWPLAQLSLEGHSGNRDPERFRDKRKSLLLHCGTSIHCGSFTLPDDPGTSAPRCDRRATWENY